MKQIFLVELLDIYVKHLKTTLQFSDNLHIYPIKEVTILLKFLLMKIDPSFSWGNPRLIQRTPYFITQTHPCNIQKYFTAVKHENFQLNFIDFFHIFAQNIYCGYTLEPSQ